MGMNLEQGSKKAQITPAMNITPLVDVVLVLLIIFMVVTPLLTKQFWLNLPKKDDSAKNEPPPRDDEKPVVMTVDRDGTVRINQNVVGKADLKDRIGRIFAARRDKVLYFDAGDEAPYGVTVEVMDIARMGGAKSVAVLTEKLAQ